MRFARRAVAVIALSAAAPLCAQQVIPNYSYPSAGTPPAVILQCDDTGNNCLPLTSTNQLKVASATQGNVADRTADSGNTVKVGGVFDNAYGAIASGQRAPLRMSAAGDLYVAGGAGTTFASPYSGQLAFIKSTSTAAYPVASSGLLLSAAGWVGAPGDTNGAWEHGTPIATPADGSGTVTTGGTSQQVFAANTARAMLSCQNPITATETLFVNIGATASTTAGSWELAPGAIFANPYGVSFTGTVNVTAVTTGHRFVCKQG